MTAPPDSQEQKELRLALIDQLEYLALEADALQDVIQKIPAPVLDSRPIEGQLSVKELYALLLRLNEAVYEPFAGAIIEGGGPRMADRTRTDILGPESWGEHPIGEILRDLASARKRLVRKIGDAPPESWANTGMWGTRTLDLYAFSYAVVHQDVEVLRELGERLQDARLSERRGGLPS